MSGRLSLKDVKVCGQRVFLRVDFNVPISQGRITNLARIEAALPTLQYLIDQQASQIVVASHLGRPNGHKDPQYSLTPVAEALAKLLDQPVKFHEGGFDTLPTDKLVLLENLRFHPEEECKCVIEGEVHRSSMEAVQKFADGLRKCGDIYVNDAFGTAHRSHTSMLGGGFPIRCAGFLMSAELESFSRLLMSPAKPFVGIVGGAKVSDKLLLLQNLLPVVDILIVGGGMAYTFLKVLENMEVGNSLFDPVGAELIPSIMEDAKTHQVKVVLPIDFVQSSEFGEKGKIERVSLAKGISPGFMGLDCGPSTSDLLDEILSSAQTILWNGPVGVFEMEAFREGSRRVAQAVQQATKAGKTTVIGGGDTATCAKMFGIESEVTHCSTGGGAALELMEGKLLPGVDALSMAE